MTYSGNLIAPRINSENTYANAKKVADMFDRPKLGLWLSDGQVKYNQTSKESQRDWFKAIKTGARTQIRIGRIC